MWRLETSLGEPLPDLARLLPQLHHQAGFFATERPLFLARAPGRLDLMGGIADYSGSLVLQLPLACATYALAQPDEARELHVRTLNADGSMAPEVALPLDELLPAAGALDYASAGALLTAERRRAWAAYVLGALVVLQRERDWRLPAGLRLLISSEVPIGKGVGSSAALEVAAMHAICGAWGWDLPPRDLALLCQKVENRIVGAPCGVMDQMTCACGQKDRLLALRCQPAELEAPVTLPADVGVFGIDSGIRHAVSGADYTSVRVGAFMGYRILAELAGLCVLPGPSEDPGRVRIIDPLWHGYLANVTPAVWEARFVSKVPEQLSVGAFLARYDGLTDTVTRVQPERPYPVRAATAHPIYEHARVERFRALLLAGDTTDDGLAQLGELMYQSHASYSACGLGTAGTDRLVELVRAAGPATGLYGAKITGGGSGGTVAILARRGSQPHVLAIARQYERETGRTALVLGGSSPGAAAFGVHKLVPTAWRAD